MSDSKPSDNVATPLSIGQCASIACLLEVTAPKPGNVHRSADFEDVTFLDFLASAVAISPPIERAGHCTLGETILACVQATRAVSSSNTNLGLILLIAPLAKSVCRGSPGKHSIDRDHLQRVLAQTSAFDSQLVYQAIRLAKPGGLGNVDKHDIQHTAPPDLMHAMHSAKDNDFIARQYANGFDELFNDIIPWLQQSHARFDNLADAIIWTHIKTMSRFPDTLIQRKCGHEIALQAANRACKSIDAERDGHEAYLRELAELDFWLRSDGNRRNPGTTADLIGAALFVELINGSIVPPFSRNSKEIPT